MTEKIIYPIIPASCVKLPSNTDLASAIGVAGGLATLDSNGKIPSVNLPSKAVDTDVYDISEANNGTTYANLAAALNNGNNIPASIRKGGISIKFIQSSDNNSVQYVQYRLMKNQWSTDVSDWQGVDENPTAGSDNLVKSGGVYDKVLREQNYVPDKKINFSGTIVNSIGTGDFISTKIPLATNDTLYWKYAPDSTFYGMVDVYDESGTYLAKWQGSNGANGERTVRITTANAAYIIVSFSGADGYEPLVKINNVVVWSGKLESQGIPKLQQEIDAIDKIIVGVEEVAEEVNKEIYFINGKAINTSGDIVNSSGTFISSKIPCNNGDSVKWVYSKDQNVRVFLEAFDVNGEKLGAGYSSVNGSDGSRTMYITKPTVSYIIATFVDTTGYTPLVQINGVTVWEKEMTLKGEVSLVHDQVDANTKQFQEYTYANLRTNIEVIAHRGVHIHGIPENSIDAYRYAGYLGYDKAETDFCPTSDNVLVLMHDASINRTMKNASDYSDIAETVNVRDKTYAELKAGYVLASTDIRYRRPIPTLEEYFKTCKESGVFPLPEIKISGTTQENVLAAFNMGCEILGEGNFGFCSASGALLDYVRTLSEITPLYYIADAIVDTVNSISGESRNDKHNVWYPSSSNVTEQSIKAHHKKGIRVVTWTISPSSYDNQIKLGCDGVATDAIAPNISSLMTVGIKTINGFSDLITNGTVTDNKLTLDNGQTATYSYSKNIYLGAFYISVICKGSVTISSNGLSRTIEAAETERFVYRGLILNATPSFTITSSADGSEIEFVEYYIQKF